jgi:hypothetical protein
VPPRPGGRDGARWARRLASQARTPAGSEERGQYDNGDQTSVAGFDTLPMVWSPSTSRRAENEGAGPNSLGVRVRGDRSDQTHLVAAQPHSCSVRPTQPTAQPRRDVTPPSLARMAAVAWSAGRKAPAATRRDDIPAARRPAAGAGRWGAQRLLASASMTCQAHWSRLAIRGARPWGAAAAGGG